MTESGGSAPLSSRPLYNVDAMRKESGLELLRRVMAGELPSSPMSELIPMQLVEVDFGRAVYQSLPSEQYYNSLGIVHGGYGMTLLDTCMGVAIYSTLREAIGYTTIETKVNFVKPITAATGTVSAVGHALHTGTRTGTAEGRLIDQKGVLYAHGTTTCFLFSLQRDE